MLYLWLLYSFLKISEHIHWENLSVFFASFN